MNSWLWTQSSELKSPDRNCFPITTVSQANTPPDQNGQKLHFQKKKWNGVHVLPPCLKIIASLQWPTIFKASYVSEDSFLHHFIDSSTKTDLCLGHCKIVWELGWMLHRTPSLESNTELFWTKVECEAQSLTPSARHLCSSNGGQPVTLFSQMYSPLSLTLHKWLSQPSWNVSSCWKDRVGRRHSENKCMILLGLQSYRQSWPWLLLSQTTMEEGWDHT